MRLPLLLLCLSLYFTCSSQEELNDAANYWIQYQENESSLEGFIEELETYFIEPLTINSASIDALERFPLFHQRHVNVLRRYLLKNENILSWQELENLSYFNPEFVKIIQPFILLTAKEFVPHPRFILLSRFKTTLLQNQRDTLKMGSNIQSLFRFKGSWKNNKVGFTWEKDANEPFNFQYNLFKISFQKQFKSFIKQLNLGAYSLNTGSGLIHSNAFLPNHGNAMNSIRTNLTSNESNYSNGISLFMQRKNFHSIVAFHYKAIDGLLQNDTLQQIKTDGNFTSLKDIPKRKTASETFILLSNQIQHKRLKVSLNHKLYQLSHTYAPKNNYYSSKQYKQLINNSIGLQFKTKNLMFKGEAANYKKSIASTFFINYEVTDNINIETNFRHFSKPYLSHQSSTVQRNSSITNESGGFLKTSWITYQNQFSIQYDIFNHKNPRFQNHLPSYGKTLDIRYTHQPSDSIRVKIRYRFKANTKDNSGSLLDERASIHHHLISTQYRFNPTHKTMLTTRLDWIHNTNHSGYMIAQDFKFKRNNKGYIAARIAIINSPEWDNRFYVYEADVLYAFSIPVYYDQALKTYILYNYKHNRSWNFWLKYDFTYFPNKETVNLGKPAPTSLFKSNLKWQVQFTF